jgi:hypothetical protein
LSLGHGIDLDGGGEKGINLVRFGFHGDPPMVVSYQCVKNGPFGSAPPKKKRLSL